MSEDDIIHAQLSTLQLLISMYPLTSELLLSSSTASYLDVPTSSPPSALEADLHLPVDESTNTNTEEENMHLHLVLSLSHKDAGVFKGAQRESESDTISIRPKQPPWVSNSHYSDLINSLPSRKDDMEGSEYILMTIEHVRQALQALLPSSSSHKSPTDGTDDEGGNQEVSLPEERVWYWFPSLSSKEKRDDLVSFAEEVGLTGFVLAGKPGLLCVEGYGPTIDRYMARIKSESWSDIPPFQKKVTERLRKPIPPPPPSPPSSSAERTTNRAFSTMKEITHLIPKYGQYNHRGEMGEVRRLMEEWGVGDDFGAVVLNNS
ncbi:hypothetical protein IAR55_002498 [Kwoniella newhampshirensis]|uniref:Small nuclear ribonucleoprotein Prp3 C-terminal domain-containing protein n=1 Tax=Kwoniella newhampshirensis TaxID=1651941 RepID=A0AAW0Z1M4_9TREE